MTTAAAMRNLLIAVASAAGIMYFLPLALAFFGYNAAALLLLYVAWDLPWSPFHSIRAGHLEMGHGLPGATGLVFNFAFYTLLSWGLLRLISYSRLRRKRAARQ